MIAGVCQVCGCTETKPCFLDDVYPALTCSWIDEAQTLCSNLRCVAVIPLDELMEIVLPGCAHATGTFVKAVHA